MDIARASVCRECRVMMRRQTSSAHVARSFVSATPQRRQFVRSFATTPSATRNSKRPSLSTQDAFRIAPITSRTLATALHGKPVPSPSKANSTTPDLAAIHARIDELTNTILKPADTPIPAEQRTLYVFEQLESLTITLQDKESKAVREEAAQKTTSKQEKQTTATSALLGSVNARKHPSHLTRASLLDTISSKAEQALRHPNVFITPAILKSYVDLQSRLHAPASFPDAFDLYASKASPRLSGQEVTYQKVSPDKVSSAVDVDTASKALKLAIETNHLPLALDTIMTSFCAPAFKRAKILRQALIPISGLAIAPLAAYTLGSQFGSFQSTMDPTHATMVAFAGIMTYIGAVASMGYIAITTSNDQMRRVTWATGVPLWERWIREEERAAIDSVAEHWGFEDTARRGDEEGQEWDNLREFVGRRGMVLDRVELMDGME